LILLLLFDLYKVSCIPALVTGVVFIVLMDAYIYALGDSGENMLLKEKSVLLFLIASEGLLISYLFLFVFNVINLLFLEGSGVFGMRLLFSLSCFFGFNITRFGVVFLLTWLLFIWLILDLSFLFSQLMITLSDLLFY